MKIKLKSWTDIKTEIENNAKSPTQKLHLIWIVFWGVLVVSFLTIYIQFSLNPSYVNPIIYAAVQKNFSGLVLSGLIAIPYLFVQIHLLSIKLETLKNKERGL